MTLITVSIVAVGAFGLFMLGRSVAHLRRRRIMAAGRNGLGGSVCLALAGIALALMANLYTYERLTYEQPVATLRFTRLGPQHYRVVLTTADGRRRTLKLNGDQWQLDARVLKWRGFANLLGFDALYRLDRISGRYASITQENTRAHRAVSLHAARPGLDAFKLANDLPRWAAFVDATYGSGTYMPMANGAAYSVRLSQSGLVARPANDRARQAMRRWSG